MLDSFPPWVTSGVFLSNVTRQKNLLLKQLALKMNLRFNFLGTRLLSFICYFCPCADGEIKDKSGLQSTSSQD